MLLKNLKIFFSNLLKHKLFTLVNVVGLSMGLASCLLISLYVVDEFSYDRQHPGAERIYRISSILAGVGQGRRIPISSMSPQAGPLLQQNFPEIEAFTRESREPIYLSLDDQGHHEDRVSFADPNFFSFFLFTWLQGEPSAALSEPDSIVLTQSLAFKYFGTGDVLGKTLQLQRQRPVKVTGVIRDLQRTHIDAQAFVTMSTLEWLQEPQAMEDWFNNRFQTYVRLREGASFTQLQPLFHQFLEDQMPLAAKSIYDPDSTAVRDIHLFSSQSTGLSREDRIQDIVALMVVCAALLAIACINFVNLATARSSERGKEIAMRKVMGARRGQIFRQHMGESALLVMFSLLLALGITELSLPLLNGFTGKAIGLTGTPFLLLAVAGLGLMVALLAGAYPSLYLSAFMPAKVFKPAGGAGKGGAVFRNLLVIVQFAISIVLIVATAVIHQQIQYGKRIELGFDKDQVVVIENEAGSDWALFKERVLATAGVSQVSAAMTRPFRPVATSVIARHEGGSPKGENRSFFAVDFDYFELFDVEFIAGRSFAEHLGGDRIVQPTAENPRGRAAFVLNRAMVNTLGWTPEEATGKWIELNWSENYAQSVRGEVVGVAENMRADSLHREVTPLLYWVPTKVSGLSHGLIKTSTADVAETLQRIDAIWREVYPDRPINRYFLNAEFRVLYEAEERQAGLLSVFALLAIVISCLGLFGLAAFTAERRRKEVGIRKVLGSDVLAIVRLLTNDFSRLVLISNVIAWPVAWFAMERWLSNFAYRIDLTPMIFIASGLIAFCIAWATVGGTALRSANARPVLALRYE